MIFSAVETAVHSDPSPTPSLAPQQMLDRIAAIALRLRQFLELDSVLNTAANEVRELLQTDRVLIYRFQPDGSGLVVVESVNGNCQPLLGQFIHDPCFNARFAESYRNGRVHVIDDIYTSDIKPCYLALLAQFQVRANLVVPILQAENLWGLLIAHQCSSSRQWQLLEVDLLQQLALQMGLGIQQAELYQQLQTELTERRRAEAALSKLNEELEARVMERTAELRQANEFLQAEIAQRLEVERGLQESQLCFRLINTISTARNTGLSVEQIIARTLSKIHQFFSHLGIAYCTVNEQAHSNILQAIEPPGMSLYKGSVTDLTIVPDYLHTLRQGEPIFTENVTQEPCLTPMAQWLQMGQTQALLAVPVRHSEKLVGILSLHAIHPQRWSEYQIGTLMEIADYLSLTLQEAYEHQERQKAELALQKLNEQLEAKVEERTAELRRANEQLLAEIERRRCVEAEVLQALERERELNELKSRIITMISHEYRTPLTTILSSAELLQNYGHRCTDQQRLTYLQRIQNSVKRMTRLVSDVLLIGEAEAGKLQFNPAPLNLEKFCQELVEELQVNCGSQYTLTFLSQSRYPTTCLDEKLLRQILSNLLTNAIKYSLPGTQVHFELSSDWEAITFRIQDQGIGIPTAEQGQLFNAFHRASNVGTVSGTGLGLAIVKKAVDLHNGQITFVSEVGVGTTFTVTLPLDYQPLRF